MVSHSRIMRQYTKLREELSHRYVGRECTILHGRYAGRQAVVNLVLLDQGQVWFCLRVFSLTPSRGRFLEDEQSWRRSGIAFYGERGFRGSASEDQQRRQGMMRFMGAMPLVRRLVEERHK